MQIKQWLLGSLLLCVKVNKADESWNDFLPLDSSAYASAFLSLRKLTQSTQVNAFDYQVLGGGSLVTKVLSDTILEEQGKHFLIRSMRATQGTVRKWQLQRRKASVPLHGAPHTRARVHTGQQQVLQMAGQRQEAREGTVGNLRQDHRAESPFQVVYNLTTQTRSGWQQSFPFRSETGWLLKARVPADKAS